MHTFYRRFTGNNFKIVLSLLCIGSWGAFADQREVRSIKPPRLETAHFGKRIHCYRPVRHGSPDMAVRAVQVGFDDKQLKIVATNAGHGGSGWTLGPGSARYLNSLLIDAVNSADMSRDMSGSTEDFPESICCPPLTTDTPITIIGAGALGLFSAYDLIQRGYTNITIVAENWDNLASHYAGGLCAPGLLYRKRGMQQIITDIGIDSFAFYMAIAHNKIPAFQGGAAIMPVYFHSREESGLEAYVGTVMQPAKDVILDFGNGTTRTMVAYDDGIFIDTAKMMTALHAYIAPRVTFITQKITDFGQIKDTYIINCTGLGSKELNNDTELVSAQGHLIMLKDQNPDDLQYIVFVHGQERVNNHNQKIKRLVCIFPKRATDTSVNDVGVIGGTYIEGATQDTPNDEEFDRIIAGIREFYGVNR